MCTSTFSSNFFAFRLSKQINKTGFRLFGLLYVKLNHITNTPIKNTLDDGWSKFKT